MSDSYWSLWLVTTNLLPQICFTLLFPAIVLGVAVKFMRNL